MTTCMNALPSPPDATKLAKITSDDYRAGSVADPSNLGHQLVYMFSGTKVSSQCLGLLVAVTLHVSICFGCGFRTRSSSRLS